MAKKKKKEFDFDNPEKEKKGSKILTILITFLIIIIWLFVFALLIKLDVGGFGSKVLRPVLKDVPIINKILPDVSDEELAEEKDYPYKNLDEAIAKIMEQEAIIKDLEKNGNVSSDKVAELEAEIKRLQVFEENQVNFEKREKEFDENVVFADSAPSIEEYQKYYEQINPNNAEDIYRQVIEQQQYEAKIVEQAKMYAAMEPDAAAKVLEVLSEGDVDLVAKILSKMKAADSAEILGAMDSVKAARISKKMSQK